MTTYILVAGSAGVANLIEAASSLDGPVTAVVAGPAAVAQAVAAPGVDKVVWLGEPGDKALEAFGPAAAAVVAAAPGVVLAGRSPAERGLLGSVAAAVGAPVVTGATEIKSEGGQTVATHGVYTGIALETGAYAGPVAFVLDGGAPVAGGGSAAVETAPAAPTAITVTGLSPHAEQGADLTAAARVVGIGRGLKQQADLPVAEALAKALKGELGCSRPVAEGLEWLPRDRYVGISGNHIKPDLYVMVGISGQLQHMGGCRDSKVIVSINTDKDAPVAAQSDYILVGDLYTLVPAITAALG
ncbi:MAG: electron transfer flavoprotein subunit alpha/FixB family protein [Propionibacteriaceae bacterium]|jgi:electron transfer flavoprotein alpha subunit|nr:electron transfer flavoprotein subunit alpha/FixB family protein [Propionibacteriaceae bacterium]